MFDRLIAALKRLGVQAAEAEDAGDWSVGIGPVYYLGLGECVGGEWEAGLNWCCGRLEYPVLSFHDTGDDVLSPFPWESLALPRWVKGQLEKHRAEVARAEAVP